MEKKKYTAVIRVTDDPTRAIESVCKLKKYIETLYLVNAPEDTESKFADTRLVGEVDLNLLETNYVLEIPPSCKLNIYGIEALTHDVTKYTKERHTQYALTTKGILPAISFMHGFLMVMAAIHFVMALIRGWRFHRSSDVIVYPVIHSGDHVYLGHKKTWYNYISNDWCAPITVYSGASVIHPTGAYVLRELGNDPHLGCGWYGRIPHVLPWMFGYFLVWIYLVTSMVYLAKDPSYFIAGIIGGMWSVGWLIILYATTRWYKFPGLLLTSLGLPIHVFFFPFVLIYARLFNE